MRHALINIIATAMLLANAGALSAEERAPRTLTITGTGAISAVPDIACVRTAIETYAETASAALDANSEPKRLVLAALSTASIAQRDIQTSGIAVTPRYNDRKSG
ncbi:MAG: SIMPL domain-containing protein [Pseudomonadota bacterium]